MKQSRHRRDCRVLRPAHHAVSFIRILKILAKDRNGWSKPKRQGDEFGLRFEASRETRTLYLARVIERLKRYPVVFSAGIFYQHSAKREF